MRAWRWEPSALITKILLARPPLTARSNAIFLPLGEKPGVKPEVPRSWKWLPSARMTLIRPSPRGRQATIRLLFGETAGVASGLWWVRR